MERNLMNHPEKIPSLPQSNSDSFFGMALVQAFTGMVYGADVYALCNAGNALSAIHEDRHDQKRTNGRGGVYELGTKKSLAGDFARMTEPTLAERERMTFRPSYDRSTPALAA